MSSNKNAARVKSYDDRLKESGGRVIHKLRLKPEAAKALAEMEQKGMGSPTAIINSLLVESKAMKDGDECWQPRPWDPQVRRARELGEEVFLEIMGQAQRPSSIEKIKKAIKGSLSGK